MDVLRSGNPARIPENSLWPQPTLPLPQSRTQHSAEPWRCLQHLAPTPFTAPPTHMHTPHCPPQLEVEPIKAASPPLSLPDERATGFPSSVIAHY